MPNEELRSESCLLLDQSGLPASAPEKAAISHEEATLATVELDAQAMEAYAAVEGVPAPPIYRTYQARAVSRANRTKDDIDGIILHTPEGGESGTLSVLNDDRASFDWFLPPAGRLYKTNDYYRYIAWQAGDWPWNQRSIGIEQWDYAANMHNAPESHYDRLARLCAYLVESLELAIRKASGYHDYGFIYHRVVTPGRRCDPDNCGQSRFEIDMLLDKVSDLVKGRPAPPTPEKGLRWINAVYHASDPEAKRVARAMATGLKAVNLPAGATPRNLKAVIDARTQEGVYAILVGERAIEGVKRHRKQIEEAAGKGFSLDATGWVQTVEGDLRVVARWRIAALADEYGADKQRALDAYEAAL